MKEDLLTREYAIECLDYNSDTGIFLWKERPIEHFKSYLAFRVWNGKYSGKVAGAINEKGYISISINKTLFQAHRLAWLIHYGSWPHKQIDHINRNPGDNRISNLRDVSSSINLFNRGVASNNKSGKVGVSYCNTTKSWCSTYGHKRIGRFKTLEEAIASRASFEERIMGENDYGKN